MPAIIAIHGYTGTAVSIAQNSEFWKLKNVTTVYPQGYYDQATPFENSSWNAGTCCAGAKIKGSDDVAYINGIIDDLIENHDVDKDRIYVHGWSNGAMMTYRLICEIGDRIKAAVPYAGGLQIKNFENTDYGDRSKSVVIDKVTYIPFKADFTVQNWLGIQDQEF